jgi:intraflagellar transport protein 74
MVGTDPAELNDYITEFRAKNKQFANEIDRVFVIKKQKDEETKQIEAQIRDLHELAQHKINELEPEKLNRYNRLLDQSSELMRKQDAALADVDGLVAQIHDLEDSNHRPSYSDEYTQLSKRRARLQKEERSLSEELAIWELTDPKEALVKLKRRVETQSKELKEYDGYSKDFRDRIISSQKQLTEILDELKERKGESGGDKDKYEKLRQRDDEMSSFIAQFEMTRSSTLKDQQQTQDTIIALLEHVSQGLEQQNSMPSQQRLREMRDEATFKERQLESSQQTTQRLIQERKQREAEMLKIENLDEKIQIELASLQQKMEVMRGDMLEFDDIDGLRQRAAATMSALSRLLKEYQSRQESVRSQVACFECHSLRSEVIRSHISLQNMKPSRERFNRQSLPRLYLVSRPSYVHTGRLYSIFRNTSRRKVVRLTTRS